MRTQIKLSHLRAFLSCIVSFWTTSICNTDVIACSISLCPIAKETVLGDNNLQRLHPFFIFDRPLASEWWIRVNVFDSYLLPAGLNMRFYSIKTPKPHSGKKPCHTNFMWLWNLRGGGGSFLFLVFKSAKYCWRRCHLHIWGIEDPNDTSRH